MIIRINQQNANGKLIKMLAKLQLIKDMNIAIVIIIPNFINNEINNYGDCVTEDDDAADDDVNDYLWLKRSQYISQGLSQPPWCNTACSGDGCLAMS